MPRARSWRWLAIALVLAPSVLPSSIQASLNQGAYGGDFFGLVWISPPKTPASPLRLKQARDLGAEWDRFPFYWSDIQPAAGGAFDWASIDAVLDAETAAGLKVQAILMGAPAWATGGGAPNLDAWTKFVTAAVTRYRGRVTSWEMWNEPDLLAADGRGSFWPWSLEDYANLLRAGYRAAKAADANATVLLAGVAFPYNNQDWFARFLELLSKDPQAANSGYYFDVLPLHLYGRSVAVFDLPTGYVGAPDFVGFHNLMRARGFDKPIWINETGVAVWEGGGINGPGRATADEQAAFVLQTFAYAMAADIRRVFIFQLYDDGAGAIDPASGKPAEFYGLIDNAGRPRPAYTAYQTVARYLTQHQLVTRVNLGRTGDPNIKGVELITLYGTSVGKATVLWNSDGGAPREVKIPAQTPRATLVDKLGKETPLVASGGVYTIPLLPATNNNNFNCYTPSGCNDRDYIMGGSPVILVEGDATVPAATIQPLPTGVRSPFSVTWSGTRAGVASFDLQYMDVADSTWHDWLSRTPNTTAVFGGPDMPALRNHTYAFRVRARDAGGNLMNDFTPTPMASSIVLNGSTSASAAVSAVAKLEIAWPHTLDGQQAPVTQAPLLNLGAYLLDPGGQAPSACQTDRTVRLWRALNAGAAEPVAVAKRRFIDSGGKLVPLWEFNDVDVAAARDPVNKYYFFLTVDDQNVASNFWSHGSDARTYFPQVDVPKGVAGTMGLQVDPKIEIVFPHDETGKPASVDGANLVNVAVDIYAHGSTNSIPIDANPNVRLMRAINNGAETTVDFGHKIAVVAGGITYPRWEFNNVDVSAARDPANKYFFRVVVDGVTTFSNVWSHGVDARTYFPEPDRLSAGC